MLARNLICMLALACSAAAAAKQPEAPPPEAMVKLQFTSVQPIAGPHFLLSDIGEATAINIPQNNLSPVVQVPVMNKWTIGRKDPNNGAFIIEAQGHPLKSDHQIIVITPDEDGGNQLTAVEGNPGVFKPNTVLYLNNSTTKIAGNINKDRMSLIQQDHRIMMPDPQLAVMKYTFYYLDSKKNTKPFRAGAMPAPRNNSRYLIIFYPDRLKGHPNFQMLRIQPQQLMPPPKA